MAEAVSAQKIPQVAVRRDVREAERTGCEVMVYPEHLVISAVSKDAQLG